MKTKKKVCKKCELKKPREDFNRITGPSLKPEWDCRDSYCKVCRLIYQVDRRRNIKQQAVEYLGGKCEICDLESECYAVYDFHHNDGGKDFSISASSKSFESIKAELDKCVLICANCHRIVHYNGA